MGIIITTLEACAIIVYQLLYYIIVAFQKKVDTLAKAKECDIVGVWKKSMTNHLYWSTVSTPCGEEEMILAKWLSLANHVQNIHSGHSDLFPTCAHPQIYSHKKKWLQPRTY